MLHVTGNLLDMVEAGHFNVIIHGCNCFNTMGSGIARQIADRYPLAYEVDQQTKKGDRLKLGNFTYAKIEGKSKTPFLVINAYTQYRYDGRLKGEMDVDYTALVMVMHKINQIFLGRRIGYPMIGAGLAGGDWGVIAAIINSRLKDTNHVYVEYDQK